MRWTLRSAERERERFQAGFEKLDLEVTFAYRSRLANKLIQALLGHPAKTVVVDVSAMGRAHRLAIDEHAETHRTSARRWSQDEMEIPRGYAMRPPATLSTAASPLTVHCPERAH